MNRTTRDGFTSVSDPEIYPGEFVAQWRLDDMRRDLERIEQVVATIGEQRAAAHVELDRLRLYPEGLERDPGAVDAAREALDDAVEVCEQAAAERERLRARMAAAEREHQHCLSISVRQT